MGDLGIWLRQIRLKIGNFGPKFGPKFQGPPRAQTLEAGFGRFGKFGLKMSQISPKRPKIGPFFGRYEDFEF